MQFDPLYFLCSKKVKRNRIQNYREYVIVLIYLYHCEMEKKKDKLYEVME